MSVDVCDGLALVLCCVRGFLSGVVVDSFPKQACQTLVTELGNSGGLSRPSEEQLAVRQAGADEKLREQLSLVVNTRAEVRVEEQSRLNDMRVLLTKELRHLLRQKERWWAQSLDDFVKKEAAARMQFAGKFLETMKVIKGDYELRVRVQGAGDSSAEVGIKKIFLIEVLNDFPNVLLQGNFFSATLQLFLSTIFQYPRTRISMERGPMEATFQKHMQMRDATEEGLADRLFAHVTDPDKYFHPGARALFIDVLKLAWKYYHEHSEKMLQLLQEDTKAFSFFLGSVMYLPSATENDTSTAFPHEEKVLGRGSGGNPRVFGLDTYGFATAVHLAVWQDFNKAGGVALLQSTCRFVFVARSRSGSAATLPLYDFAILSARFTSTFQTPQGGIFSGVFLRTRRPFSLSLYRRLKNWDRAEPLHAG